MSSAINPLQNCLNPCSRAIEHHPVRAIVAVAIPIIALIAALVIHHYYPQITKNITIPTMGAAITALALVYIWVFVPACQASPKEEVVQSEVTAPASTPSIAVERTAAMAEYIREHYDIVDTNIESKDPDVIAQKAKVFCLGELHLNTQCHKVNGDFIDTFWNPGSILLVEAPISTYLRKKIAEQQIRLETGNPDECHNEMWEILHDFILFLNEEIRFFLADHSVEEYILRTHSAGPKAHLLLRQYLNYTQKINHTKKNVAFAEKILSHKPLFLQTYMFVVAGLDHFDPNGGLAEAVKAFKQSIDHQILYVSLSPKRLRSSSPPLLHSLSAAPKSLVEWKKKFCDFASLGMTQMVLASHPAADNSMISSVMKSFIFEHLHCLVPILSASAKQQMVQPEVTAPASTPSITVERTSAMGEYIRKHYDIVDTNIGSKDPNVIAQKAKVFCLGEQHENPKCHKVNGDFIDTFWNPGSHLLIECPANYFKKEIAQHQVKLDDKPLFDAEQVQILLTIAEHLKTEIPTFLVSHTKAEYKILIPSFRDTLLEQLNKHDTLYKKKLDHKKRNLVWAEKILKRSRLSNPENIFVIAGCAHFDPNRSLAEAVRAFQQAIGNQALYVSLVPKHLSSSSGRLHTSHIAPKSLTEWTQKFQEFSSMPQTQMVLNNDPTLTTITLENAATLFLRYLGDLSLILETP